MEQCSLHRSNWSQTLAYSAALHGMALVEEAMTVHPMPGVRFLERPLEHRFGELPPALYDLATNILRAIPSDSRVLRKLNKSKETADEVRETQDCPP